MKLHTGIRRAVRAGLAIVWLLLLPLWGACAETADIPDYALAENWAYFADGGDLAADVFFICPTVYAGADRAFNMPMDDGDARAGFLGATNMEKGIYDESACFYAPYYRQAGLNVYALPEEER